jgi:hypothetical protein
MKGTLVTLLIILMLIPSAALAEEPQELRTISKEYEFETTNYVFEYEPSQEIEENGLTYLYKSIDYEEIDREDLFIESEEVISKEVLIEKMPLQDDTAFEVILIDEDSDNKDEMTLQEISYTESLIDGRTAETTQSYNYGEQIVKPAPPPTLDVLYEDKESDSDILATLDFVRLEEKNAHWEDNIHVEQIYRSAYEDEYLLVDGTRLLFTDDSPAYEGYEESILTQMRLDPISYKIVGSKWLSDAITVSGQTTKVAEYTVKRHVTEYSAIYKGQFNLPNLLAYDGLALYEAIKVEKKQNGRNYTVKATVTYQEKPVKDKKPIAPIVAGVTGGFVGLCGVVFLLKKRTNNMDAL